MRALDFDHVRGKKKLNVSKLILGQYSLKTIVAEINKCEIRCKNCHAIKTAKQQNHYKHIKMLRDVRYGK